jgi:hypothetical protein
LLLQNDQHRGCVLDRALKAEPGGQGHAARRLGRHIAQVDGYETETARLHQEVRRLQRLRDVVRAHPEQALEIHTRSLSGGGVEGIAGIDDRGHLLTPGDFCQDGKQQAGAPG